MADAISVHAPRVTMRGLFAAAAERDRALLEYGAIEGGKQTLERLAEPLAKLKKRSRDARVPGLL